MLGAKCRFGPSVDFVNVPPENTCHVSCPSRHVAPICYVQDDIFICVILIHVGVVTATPNTYTKKSHVHCQRKVQH